MREKTIMMHHELSNRVLVPELVAEITMHGEVMCKDLLIEHYKLIKTTKVFVHKGMSPARFQGLKLSLW